MFAVIALHVEIYRSLAFVSHPGIQYAFYHGYLLYDMTRCPWFDAWFEHIQFVERGMVPVREILHHFHGFQLLEPGFLGNFIFALVGIIFEVTHIGNVTHITYFISQVAQVTEYQVECNGRARMPQVSISIYSRATHIHAYMRGINGNKQFFLAR